jgi:hypothetical protein
MTVAFVKSKMRGRPDRSVVTSIDPITRPIEPSPAGDAGESGEPVALSAIGIELTLSLFQ